MEEYGLEGSVKVAYTENSRELVEPHLGKDAKVIRTALKSLKKDNQSPTPIMVQKNPEIKINQKYDDLVLLSKKLTISCSFFFNTT